MKKLILLLLVSVCLFTACSGNNSETEKSETEITSEDNTENETNEQADNTVRETKNNQDSPVVYMTTDISPKGLMAVYNKLGFKPEGNVAVKLSTGEPPASNYLDPNLIKDLVQSVNGTIVEKGLWLFITSLDLSRKEM